MKATRAVVEPPAAFLSERQEQWPLHQDWVTRYKHCRFKRWDTVQTGRGCLEEGLFTVESFPADVERTFLRKDFMVPQPTRSQHDTSQCVKIKHFYAANMYHCQTQLHNEGSWWYFKISFIFHFVVCLTTGPQPLPKPVLHTVGSSVCSFHFQYSFL